MKKLLLLALMLTLCSFVEGQGQAITFSAVGDGPYSDSEVPEFQEQISGHNLYSPSAFFVHVGDIFHGSVTCDTSRYSFMANMLRDLAVPVYIIPGDNETIDCSSPEQGRTWWKQYFINYEQNFCGATLTEHQSIRPENWAFLRDGVLFIGLNMVGGNSPYLDDANWVSQQLQAKGSHVRAAVIFSHVKPDHSTVFSTPFRQAAAAFGKPILFLHGHGHVWSMGYPFPEPNILRVQVDNLAAEDPVEVTVTLDTSSPATAFVLKRNPWQSQTIVNIPPCVNAGLDQIISFPQSTTLNAGASDDGDPNPPGALTVTWSKVSGPGTVTFGNANALTTTASFSSVGAYTLRLTASDGQLQSNDEVKITASDGRPIIDSFSPASGAAGTEVTITGSDFTDITGVTFNGMATTSFSVDNATQIRATVPVGASTGKIGVTNSVGTGLSATNFTALYSLMVNTQGSGIVALNPPGGIYNAGTVVTLTPQSGTGFYFSGWSGDLSGSLNPATIRMNGNKTVTATFTPNGSVVHEETRTGGSSGSTLVKTSTILTGVSDHLYLAAIATRPKVNVSAVSGLGLNWVLVKAQCSGRNTTGVEVWMAQGEPSSDDTVKATFANAPQHAVMAVSRYSGVETVNPTGNMISGNTNGAKGLCSGGVDTSLYSFNLPLTVNGAMVYAAVTMRARTHTPGAGFIERTEVNQGPPSNMASIAVEDKNAGSVATATANGIFSGNVDWAAVTLEIKPLGAVPAQFSLTVNTVGSGNVVLNPPGGIYDASTVVTLTATPAAGFQFSGWNGDLSGFTNPANITMEANKTVTATFTPSGQIVHEETQTGQTSNSTTVTTSANLTAANGQLYLAAIASRWKVSVLSVSGLGLNWTLVKVQCAGQNTTGIEVWKAQGTPSGNGVVTATLSSAPSNAVIAVSRYSGVAAGNAIGNVISGNANGANGVCVGGVNTNAYSFNLVTTVNGTVAYGAATMRGVTHTPGAGYTERTEILHGGAGVTASVAVEDKNVLSASTVAVNGTFSGSVDWAAIALEIKPQGGMSKHHMLFETTPELPTAFELEQNYPNPFSSEARSPALGRGNPGTMIKFALPEAGKVMLHIYDVAGQLVRTLINEEMAAGQHAARWNGRNQLGNPVAGGIYLYRLVVQEPNGKPIFAKTQRMTLVK